MKIEYEPSVYDKINDALDDARRDNKRIRFFVLSKEEMHQLSRHWSQTWAMKEYPRGTKYPSKLCVRGVNVYLEGHAPKSYENNDNT